MRQILLEGVRVLDMSRVLAGPLCAMQLGDFGADVLKVERPGTGDDTRGWGPPFDDRGEAAYYLSVNRNKLSVAADFGNDADCDLVRSLIHDADVVIENFRPGMLDRRRLGAAAFLSRDPRLIWCTLSGFGEASNRPGYDFVVQAEAGWMSITGERHGAPMKVGVALADVIAGKDALAAILAALAARERGTLDPGSRHLQISLLHSATAALVNVAQNALVSGTNAARWGNAHPNLCPYQLFDAADAPVVIAVGTDGHWRACMRALGLEALASDPALATNAGRLAQRERIVRDIAERVQALRAAAVVAALDAADVPCGVVKSVTDALKSVDSSAVNGVLPTAPATVRFPPPRLDEHGAAVRAIGWSAFRSPENPRRESGAALD